VRGDFMPPPHRRLGMAQTLIFAAVKAISDDGRLSFLPVNRRQRIAERAVDHVVDGDAPPASVFCADKDRPSNKALAEVWQAAVEAVRASWIAAGKPRDAGEAADD
jgi:hypothetical protein